LLTYTCSLSCPERSLTFIDLHVIDRAISGAVLAQESASQVQERDSQDAETGE